MFLSRRLQDAWKVLWGRSEAQAEVLRIRGEWVEIQADIANMLAQVNRWAQRVAKQEQRAMHAELAQGTQQLELVDRPAVQDRKAALRKRAWAMMHPDQSYPLPTSEPEEPAAADGGA